MTTRRLWVVAGVTALCFAWLNPVAAHEHDSCVDCHGDPSLRTKDRKLFAYYKEWTGSIHFDAGVTCTDCHGGNPNGADKADAHGTAMSPKHGGSRAYYKNLPATCGGCHEEVLKHFNRSKHYGELQADKKAPHCATCHGAMNARVPIDIVDPTCDTCHEKEEMPDIAEQARAILYRLRIAEGYLGWTALYYEDKGEPEKIKDLQTRYQHIADAWHRFKLDRTDEESKELIVDLEGVFKQAWREKNPGTLPP